MKRRVLLVTGSTPPDLCGVGDYTEALALALKAAGVEAELFVHHRWNVGGTLAALRKLATAENALIHLQYPTEGYGHSLGPQFSSLAQPTVVTLHEFSLAHPLRKISLLPFTFRSPAIVMTSEFEGKALAKRMPWASGKIRVIPIGSNIPASSRPAPTREKTIAYFGLIMPRKGLEDLAELARLARSRKPDWRFIVMGRILTRHAEYADNLVRALSEAQVQCVFNPSVEEISSVLSRSSLGYFPFPDGASERRGSLKAALTAGLPCITTRSQQTPQAMADAVLFADDASQAFELAGDLMENADRLRRLSQAALEYAQSFSWEKIARAHIQLYEDVIAEAATK